MAIILAAANGNFTAPATWIGGVVPSSGDVAVANTRTVTLDQSVTVQELRNDTTGSATAGGFFQPSAGITLTGNVYAGDLAVASNCFRLSGAASATIDGTVFGNGYGPGSTGIAAGTYGASNTGTGTLRVKATVQGALGMPAVSGPMQFISAYTATPYVRATSGYTEVVLRNQLQVVPHPHDVKAGVTYGSDPTLTGTLSSSPALINMSASMG